MILVTGATGHIGCVLVRELSAMGHKVRALVLPDDSLTPIDGVELEIMRGNVLDPATLKAAMQGVTDVFHLAALITILPGKQPQVHRVNVEGTQNMLKAAKEAGVRRFVYTSSIHAIKRVPHGITIDETLPFDPDNNYGAYDRSKAKATMHVLEAAKDGLDAVVVCPTGVIGPYDYRVSSMTESILSAARGETQTAIEGSGYDFVDVRDVVQGLIAAWQKGKRGESYLLSGEYMPSAVMNDIIPEITGKPVEKRILPLGMAHVVANIMAAYCLITRTTPTLTPYALEVVISNAQISHAKATRELGYNPRTLRESLADTIAWYQQHPELTKKN